MKIKTENLRRKEYREACNILTGKDILKKYKITIAIFEKMILLGDVPKPDFIVGSQKMRCWKQESLIDIKAKSEKYKTKLKENDLEPCIQIDAKTRAILLSTRRFFQTMNV